jgi:hypothetical protein
VQQLSLVPPQKLVPNPLGAQLWLGTMALASMPAS